MSDIPILKPEAELQKDVSQIVATTLADDLKSIFVETMEKIFNPVAEMEIIARKSLLTEREVGLLYSVSPATLRTERSRGFGPGYIKDGKRVLYSRVALDEYYGRRVIKHMS
jgi:hypothetical protein